MLATRIVDRLLPARLFRDWVVGIGLPGRLLAFLLLCIIWALALFFATLWWQTAEKAGAAVSSSTRLVAVAAPLPGAHGGGEFGSSA